MRRATRAERPMPRPTAAATRRAPPWRRRARPTPPTEPRRRPTEAPVTDDSPSRRRRGARRPTPADRRRDDRRPTRRGDAEPERGRTAPGTHRRSASSPTHCAARASATPSPSPANRSWACSMRLGDAGIRVVATRHEGGAAFMAEAHGQLTGRPAACLGTRAVGAANLAIGIHTARQDSSPMFAIVGQVERAHRGHEAFQEIDQVATIGGLAKWAAEPARGRRCRPGAGRGGPPGPRRTAGTGAAVVPPRTCSTRRCPTRRGSTPAAARPAARPTTRSARSSSCSPPPSARSSSPAAASCGRGPRPSSCASPSCSRSRSSPRWRRADVISNDHPLYLGMAGLGAAATCARAARRGRRDAGHRLPAQRADVMGGHDPGAGTRGSTSTSSRAGRSDLARAELTVAADARAFLRAANERLVGKAVLDAERVAAGRRTTRRIGRPGRPHRRRATRRRLGRPGRPSGPRSIATLRAVLPDDAILTTDAGNFAGWAGRGFRFRRPGTFLGPDVRGDGLRRAGGDRRGPRPSRPAGGRARRRRRHGDDHGRARDGDARDARDHRARLRQRALRDDPDVAGATGERRGRRAPSSARSTSRRSRAASGPAACTSSATRMSSPQCARRSPRSARR